MILISLNTNFAKGQEIDSVVIDERRAILACLDCFDKEEYYKRKIIALEGLRIVLEGKISNLEKLLLMREEEIQTLIAENKPKKPKPIGFGFVGGYGIADNGLAPIFGFGLSYNFIRI